MKRRRREPNGACSQIFVTADELFFFQLLDFSPHNIFFGLLDLGWDLFDIFCCREDDLWPVDHRMWRFLVELTLSQTVFFKNNISNFVFDEICCWMRPVSLLVVLTLSQTSFSCCRLASHNTNPAMASWPQTMENEIQIMGRPILKRGLRVILKTRSI